MVNALAIIPARKSSKRIQNKCMSQINGLPLIYYTIKAAIDSHEFTHIAVTTDGNDIKQYALKMGVYVVNRPLDLATDTAHSPDICIHAVNDMESRLNIKYDYVVLLQPTSPMRTAKHIKSAMRKVRHNPMLNGVYSICENDYVAGWLRVIENNQLQPFLKDGVDYFNMESQQVAKTYKINGAIYIVKKDILLQQKRIVVNELASYILMNEPESLDIDTKMQLKLAGYVMRHG